MARKPTQRDRVLAWLIMNGDLTVRDAMLELNINSLPKRIEELRKAGYPIEMKWVTTDSGSRYGVYTMGR